MSDDYRSNPSESPEGKGVARRAWEAATRRVSDASDLLLSPISGPWMRKYVEDSLGFWVMWHTFGGFEGLERLGMHRATIWRKVRKFRSLHGGMHPDEFVYPGITINHDEFWSRFAAELVKRS